MGAGDAGVCLFSSRHVTCCTRMNEPCDSIVRGHLRHEFVLLINSINVALTQPSVQYRDHKSLNLNQQNSVRVVGLWASLWNTRSRCSLYFGVRGGLGAV
jgi:hypothetical protein